MKMTIGKLAKAAAVNVDTINYYEHRDLMLPVSRTGSGYRIYDQTSLARLRFIKKAQWLGFSLSEIKRFTEFDGSEECKKSVMLITKNKLAEHEAKIKELLTIKNEIQNLTHSCESMKVADECPFIGYLNL